MTFKTPTGKENEWKLGYYGNHMVEVSCTCPVLMSLDAAPVRSFAMGNHKFRVRGGPGTLTFDRSEKGAVVKVTIKSVPSTVGESVNNDPPPQPARPDNYLAQVREKVRQSMGVQREAFGERKGAYETDSQLFEEEERAVIAEKAEKVRKDRSRKLEKQEVGDDEGVDNKKNRQNDGSSRQGDVGVRQNDEVTKGNSDKETE